MTRTTTRTLAGAAIAVLLGGFAVLPAAAETVAPSVTWTAEIADGSTYAYGSVPVAPTCVADVVTDPVTPCAVEGYAQTVGVHTLTAMVGAPDAAVAGTPTITYTVTPTWKVLGFGKPVKENGVWNVRKGGSTVPFKFVIKDETNVKSKDKTDIASFAALQISCVDKTPVVDGKTIDLLAVTAKGRALRFHDGAFHENWKTEKVAKTTVTVPAKGKGKAHTKKVVVPLCYQVTMTAVDGQSLTALFKLK